MGVMVASGTPADKLYLGGISLTDGRTEKVDIREPIENSDIAFLHQAKPLEKYDEYGGAKSSIGTRAGWPGRWR